jgi:hypothetical protein
MNKILSYKNHGCRFGKKGGGMKLIRIYKRYWIGLFPKRFWFSTWKPIWHQGKTRYITCGLWIIAFFAGDPK